MGNLVFTLQTFGVFLTLELLGGTWGTAAIGIYLLLGGVGLPVFSGFQGGMGSLLGITGGFLWGFLLIGLSYRCFETLCKPICPYLGLLLCYLCGSLWFMVWAGDVGFYGAVLRCVIPYLIPDLIKLYLAKQLSRRLRAIPNTSF